jgi:ArsR family transcriptional regulator
MTDKLKEYAEVYKAFGDITRLEVLILLRNGETCACKLLDHFDITQPTLSYHMKILIGADLVTARKDGLWVRYSLNRCRFNEALKFIHELAYAAPSHQSFPITERGDR